MFFFLGRSPSRRRVRRVSGVPSHRAAVQLASKPLHSPASSLSLSRLSYPRLPADAVTRPPDRRLRCGDPAEIREINTRAAPPRGPSRMSAQSFPDDGKLGGCDSARGGMLDGGRWRGIWVNVGTTVHRDGPRQETRERRQETGEWVSENDVSDRFMMPERDSPSENFVPFVGDGMLYR